MPNMSYCRFQNTLSDLQDCYDVLCDGVDEDEMSEYEVQAKDRLINLCHRISAMTNEEN